MNHLLKFTAGAKQGGRILSIRAFRFVHFWLLLLKCQRQSLSKGHHHKKIVMKMIIIIIILIIIKGTNTWLEALEKILMMFISDHGDLPNHHISHERRRRYFPVDLTWDYNHIRIFLIKSSQVDLMEGLRLSESSQRRRSGEIKVVMSNICVMCNMQYVMCNV